MKKGYLFVFLVFMVAGLSQTAIANSLEETFKKQIDFAPGGLITIENTNGAIEVEGWDRDVVLIEADKKASGSDRDGEKKALDEIDIDIRELGREIRIKTHLPHNNGGGFLDWIFGDHISASVHYKLFVPDKSDLNIRTTNGRIEANNVGGEIQLGSTNGRINARDMAGSMNAHTTNGSIEASFNRLDEKSDMGFHTTNGSIKVYLPEDVKCEINARTTNGSINSDFPLTIQGKYQSKSVHGSINGGGPLFELRTTNGSIKINKSD
jgi:hypothetical protein